MARTSEQVREMGEHGRLPSSIRWENCGWAARQLAEALGWGIDWVVDEEEYQLGDGETPPDEVWGIVISDADGTPLESLWSIGLRAYDDEAQRVYKTGLVEDLCQCALETFANEIAADRAAHTFQTL